MGRAAVLRSTQAAALEVNSGSQVRSLFFRVQSASPLCEFFLQPFEDGPYYNFECNAAGKMYIACGMTREGRKQVAAIHYHNVKRWTSFGRKTFKEKNGRQTWEVALIIPLDVMTSHHLRHPRGMTMRANFYKCGDKLAKPHFLSWNPVDCDHPDFHRPSSFGKITFV